MQAQRYAHARDRVQWPLAQSPYRASSGCAACRSGDPEGRYARSAATGSDSTGAGSTRLAGRRIVTVVPAPPAAA
jgi:hypothetical protein